MDALFEFIESDAVLILAGVAGVLAIAATVVGARLNWGRGDEK